MALFEVVFEEVAHEHYAVALVQGVAEGAGFLGELDGGGELGEYSALEVVVI